MKETPIGWFYEFEDMLHPNQVNFKEEKQSCFTNLIESLKREINAFRPHFIDQLGHSRKQARILLMQVISTSNAIHNYLTIYHITHISLVIIAHCQRNCNTAPCI